MGKLEEIERDVTAEAEIDKSNLSDEFSKQPSQYAYWAFRAEHAKKLKNEAKLQLEVFQARRGKDLRLAATTKVTDKGIENLIKASEDYTKYYESYNKALYREGIFARIVDSFQQKGQMLISLGAHSRAEMGGEISILKEKVKEKIGKSKKP